MTRRWWIVTSLAVTLILVWVAQRHSPNAQIEAALRSAASQLSSKPGQPLSEREQIAVRLAKQSIGPDTRLVVDGVGVLKRAEISEVARAWIRENPHAIVSVESVSVHVHGETADADGELSISDSQAGDLHRSRYRFQAKLRKAGDRWGLERAEIGDKLVAEPEARP